MGFHLIDFHHIDYPTWLASISCPGRCPSTTVNAVGKKKQKISEQQEKAKGFEASKDQTLDETTSVEAHDQALYDEHILSLFHTAALNAWDRIQKLGRRTESYVRVKQGQWKLFRNFL